MGFGLGVVLVVAGAILMWALDWDIPHVDDNVLGLILFIVGILTIIVSLVVTLQGRRTTHIEEHRYDD
jgi:hypothetical protein